MAFEPWALFVGMTVVTAGLPLYYATLPPPVRTGMLYGHMALMQLVPALLGAVYVMPLTDGVHVTPGNVTYTALMMTAVLVVLVERRPQVLRTVVLLLLGVEAIKLGMIATTTWAVQSPAFESLIDADGRLFEGLSVISAIGYVLIVCELLLITAMFQVLRRRVENTTALSLAYVAVFAAVLLLDGVAYPALTGSFSDLLGGSTSGRIASKALLAAVFSVPLLVFVLRFRGAIQRYAATPLRLREVLFSPNRELVARLEQHERERISLLERTLHVAEEERQRLAGDLHDHAIQVLTAADIRLQHAARESGVDVEPIQDLVREGVGSLRRLILQLRAPEVTAATFEPLVRAYIDRLVTEGQVDVDLDLAVPDGVPDDVVGGAYRIVLEAFSNAVRHARADRVAVHVRLHEGLLEGAIRDDGIGIAADAETGPGHLGLRAMEDRASVLGGEVEVMALDEGTRVAFALPVSDHGDARVVPPPPGPFRDHRLRF